MTKDHLGQLLALAQSDRERECIKYAVFKTSGLSASAARKFYGFSLKVYIRCYAVLG